MKDNGPVTQKEKQIPAHYRLVSSTDLKGVITHCNQDFVDISGYSQEELIGSPHNIPRMRDNNVEIITSEMAAFEWLHKSRTDTFRHISRNWLK